MHYLWAPSLVGGAVVAAGGGLSGTDVAAILGSIATIISAVTGLIIALERRGNPQPKIIVVSPEEAKAMGLEGLPDLDGDDDDDEPPVSRRSARRAARRAPRRQPG